MGIHISLPQHSGHARPPENATVHWRGRGWNTDHRTRDPIDLILRDVADCLPRLAAICIIDSALNKQLVSLDRVVELLADTRRGHLLIPFLDPRAESGLETAFRVGAMDAHIGLRSQVDIPGVGRVDFVIGDRLLVECDGRQHDAPDGRRRDRRRDLISLATGHVVLRLDSPQILDEWGLTLAVLRELIARGEHRWRAVHRGRGLG
jgi:very-short-patch-repair endonuclease